MKVANVESVDLINPAGPAGDKRTRFVADAKTRIQVDGGTVTVRMDGRSPFHVPLTNVAQVTERVEARK